MLVLLFSLFFTFFTFFQTFTIYGGDGGDLATATFVGGFAHPPGYPLYSFLGYLFSFIPFGTQAWKIGFLSSIPSALTAVGIFAIVYMLTSSKISAFISSATISVTYVFWLYAIVPEVFAINSLITVLYILISLAWYKKQEIKYVYFIALLTGVAFAHHHMIIFLYPSLLYIVLKKINAVKKLKITHYIKSFFIFFLVALSYLWTVYAAYTVKPIIWNNPVNIKNLIFLITRAQYGTFLSSTHFINSITSRLFQFVALGEFYLTDFTLIGIILAVLGLFYLYKKNHHYFYFLLIGFICTGPLFFFYGSYILFTNFNIGIFERFLLMSYVFIAIFLGCGISFVNGYLEKIYRIVIKESSKRVLYSKITISAFLIIPILIFYINVSKLYPLKHDATAENFGRDILYSIDDRAILLVQGDTPVFNSLYIYHTERENYPHIKIINLNKLVAGDFDSHIKKYYPEVIYHYSKKQETFIKRFISENYNVFPIYSVRPFETYIKDAEWVPYGLVFRLYMRKDDPNLDSVIAQNIKLWKHYQNPLSGSLGAYRNLMLSNVLDYYEAASIRLGDVLLKKKDYKNALSYYKKAYEYANDKQNAIYLIASTYIDMKECVKAKETIEKAHTYKSIGSDENLYIEAQFFLYKFCFNDEKKASELKKKIDAIEEKKKKSLQELIK